MRGEIGNQRYAKNSFQIAALDQCLRPEFFAALDLCEDFAAALRIPSILLHIKSNICAALDQHGHIHITQVVTGRAACYMCSAADLYGGIVPCQNQWEENRLH